MTRTGHAIVLSESRDNDDRSDLDQGPGWILADGAERGVVVADGAIVELAAKGREPNSRSSKRANHVVIPGLINTHHHFCQTLTRAVPAALDRELFPWLKALYPRR